MNKVTKTTLRNNESIRIQTTGHNYDFIATVEKMIERKINYGRYAF